MRFQPKTKDEIAAEGLWPAGTYDFEVVTASDEVSKTSGADMIKLKVKIFEGEDSRTIFDYLLESVGYKLRHFCEATGLLDEYDAGSLQGYMCEGKTGKCRVVIEKDKTGRYPDKNQISDYVVENAAFFNDQTPKLQVTSNRAAAAVIVDDDVPF